MNVLVISLPLLILASILERRRILFTTAWVTFSLYWFLEAPYYYSIQDYYNTLIVISAGLLCLLMAKLSFKEVDESITLFTKVSAIASTIYFLSLFVDPIHHALINNLAEGILYLSYVMGFPEVTRFDWNLVGVPGKPVELIFACTGIESMALFAGISFASKERISKRILAFLVSVPVIYFLNLLRNIFIILAYGHSWFGENSFYFAHHIIAKLGSTLALILIAYAVLKLLPDVLEMMDKIFRRVREEI